MSDKTALDEIKLLKEQIAAVVQERDALKDEVESDGVTIDRMSKILAETAIALKGPEKELQRHGCHDIPKLASAAMIEIDVLKACVAELERLAATSIQDVVELHARTDHNGIDWIRREDALAALDELLLATQKEAP